MSNQDDPVGVKEEPRTPDAFSVAQPEPSSQQRPSNGLSDVRRLYAADDSPDELATPDINVAAIRRRRRRRSGESIDRSADESDHSQYEEPDEDEDDLPEEREDPSPSPRSAARAKKRRKTRHSDVSRSGRDDQAVPRYDPRLASDPEQWYYRTREDFDAASKRTRLRIHHVARMLFDDAGESIARPCTECKKKRPRSVCVVYRSALRQDDETLPRSCARCLVSARKCDAQLRPSGSKDVPAVRRGNKPTDESELIKLKDKMVSMESRLARMEETINAMARAAAAFASEPRPP